MDEELATERAVFEQYIDEWRRSRLGLSVLIKGAAVIGFFPSLTAAFAEGTKRYGLESFFVREIRTDDEVNVLMLSWAV